MFFIVFNSPYLLTFGVLEIPVPNVDSVSNTTLVELSSYSPLMTEGGLETINVCAPDKCYILFPYTGWMAYGLAAYNIVPFVFLMVGNITIITVITRASAARQRMSSRGKYVDEAEVNVKTLLEFGGTCLKQKFGSLLKGS